MIRFPTKTLFVEGPDCSGKTTLIQGIHNSTNYRWHIFDRSQISRSIFSKLYKRDAGNIDFSLHEELSNLNNRFIILLPEFDVISERFNRRGDKIHKDISSIKNVYDAFNRESYFLNTFPNVEIFKSDTDIASMVLDLKISEICSLEAVSDTVYAFVDACQDKESYPLSFTLYDDGKFDEASSDILDYENEREYYDMIRTTLLRKIDMELSGNNEYKRVETSKSRRFVYSDSSCISFIQVAIRDEVMDFHSVIRSTDVKNIFPHDLKFLYFLASECFNRIGGAKSARLRFNLNSAHIIE